MNAPLEMMMPTMTPEPSFGGAAEMEMQRSTSSTIAASPPSLSAAANRYVSQFDRIRLLHHWLLAECGRHFVHADAELEEHDDAQSHDDDNERSVSGLPSSLPPPPPFPTSLASAASPRGFSCATSPSWSRWRRHANRVVRLIRSADAAVTSALTPVLDNVNLDRSVNFAHRAIQMWLDAMDLGVACSNALPDVASNGVADADSNKGGLHGGLASPEGTDLAASAGTTRHTRQQRLLLDTWDDTLKRSDGTSIAVFLQNRRKLHPRRGGGGGGGGGGRATRGAASAASRSRLVHTDGTSSGDDVGSLSGEHVSGSSGSGGH